MSALAFYSLTAVGNGLNVMLCIANLSAAAREGNTLRAIGWGAGCLGFAVLAAAFAYRARWS